MHILQQYNIHIHITLPYTTQLNTQHINNINVATQAHALVIIITQYTHEYIYICIYRCTRVLFECVFCRYMCQLCRYVFAVLLGKTRLCALICVSWPIIFYL